MDNKYSYGGAIREALYDEMQRDKSIVLMGEDIRYNLYAYTEGLYNTFGEDRVLDVPLSEAAVMGTAIGAAMCGLRPIVDLTIANFLYVAMDQIVSMAAKTRYQYNGQFKLPLTIVVSSAYGGSAGAQHSDRPHPIFMNIPGLKIITPSTVQDMYSMLRSAIQDDNPVLCFEDKSIFYKEEIVDKNIRVPIGQARILKGGTDITLIGIQNCANQMLKIGDELEKDNISAEVIDVRTLVPFDKDTVLKSVKKTGKVVIADTANRTCSAAANISAIIAEEVFTYLKGPIRLVATEDIHLPYSDVLEQALLPTKEKIVSTVYELTRKK